MTVQCSGTILHFADLDQPRYLASLDEVVEALLAFDQTTMRCVRHRGQGYSVLEVVAAISKKAVREEDTLIRS